MKKEICILCGAIILLEIVASNSLICEKCLKEQIEHIHIPHGNYQSKIDSHYIAGINGSVIVNSTSSSITSTSFFID